MKIGYKIEVHRFEDKKKKNETHLKIMWKVGKGDDNWGSNIEYCCDEMKKHTQGYEAFLGIAIRGTDFVNLKYDERYKPLSEPVVTLNNMDDNGYGDGCSHNEVHLPIKFCPFCAEEITVELLEKKKITHKCKKITKTYEECEDIVTEEIV